MIKTLKYILFLLFLPLWWGQYLIPRNKNIWVFGAWYGEKFSDNSKYLYLYLLKNHPEIKSIWLTRDRNLKTEIKKTGGYVYYTNSIKAVYYSLLAKNIILVQERKMLIIYLLTVQIRFNSGMEVL